MDITSGAIRKRDAAAWDALYDRHADEVYGFLSRALRADRSAVDDQFQEVWVEAVQRIEKFDEARGELRTWLFEIARRKVALHWRKRLPNHAGSILESPDEALAADDGAVLPQAATEQLELAEVVHAALLVLAPERRQALTDKYVDGQSVDQIAGRIGKSPKAVESLLSRAREELRSLLRWYFPNNTGGK